MENNRAPLLDYIKLVHYFKAINEFKLDLQSVNTQFRSKFAFFFILCDIEIWQMALKNNMAPLLCHFRLCESFCSHQSIQTGVTVWKRPIRVDIGDFLSSVSLKFDGWPQKAIGQLFYANSSFVHHFIAISLFKLGLQSGNAKFGSKSAIFCPVWPWNLTDDLEKQYGTSSEPFPALCIIL